LNFSGVGEKTLQISKITSNFEIFEHVEVARQLGASHCVPPAAATASAPSHGCCIRGSPRGCHVSWAGRWVQLSPGLCKHHHHGRLPVSLLPDCASSAPATAAEGHHEGGYKSTFLDGELLRLEPESLGWPCTHGGGASDEVPVSGRYLRTRNPCSRSSASCARRAFD